MIRWLFSKTVREAGALRKHVYRLLCAQRDLMTPGAVQLVSSALVELQSAINDPMVKKPALQKKMAALEEVGTKWLKPYPHAATRENVEVLLVAIAVAMGIRTFFLQPFKIPTGSMQPTLFGVTSEPDYYTAYAMMDGGMGDRSKVDAEVKRQQQLQADVQIPTGWERFKEWLKGSSYVHFVAPADGSVQKISKPWPGAIISLYQQIEFAGQSHTIWFPPDYGEQSLELRAGLAPDRVYHQGEDVIKMRVHAGDHLFIDRLSYNFRKPERGEIVVFETRGIPEEQRDMYRIPPDEFYIKRLVGLGGETLSLKEDYEVAGVPQPQFAGQDVSVGHLVVNGQPLSTATPRFENLYSFADAPAKTNILQYQDDHYYGHALIRNLAPGQEFQVRTNYLFVMGDNTMNSLDSRFWGDFPASSVIGKSFFVYWPLTKRFGIGQSISLP